MEDIKKKNDVKKGCFSMVILAIILFFIVKSCTGSKDLNATVHFTGTQFVITNNDSVKYDDVKVTLNGIYKLNIGEFPANKVYTVGILQFADDAGNRFKIGMKPQKITISGVDENGDDAFTYLEYK